MKEHMAHNINHAVLLSELHSFILNDSIGCYNLRQLAKEVLTLFSLIEVAQLYQRNRMNGNTKGM